LNDEKLIFVFEKKNYIFIFLFFYFQLKCFSFEYFRRSAFFKKSTYEEVDDCDKEFFFQSHDNCYFNITDKICSMFNLMHMYVYTNAYRMH